MSIVKPDVYSFSDTDPIIDYGEAMVTFGLVESYSINGYGAVTRGFLWQLYDIWFDQSYADNLATTWAAGASLGTSWAAGASIGTTWAPSQYGIYGSYTP